MNAEQIAQHWMDQCCNTIQQYDHAAHMNLISKDVQVFGVPGFDVIGYSDWFSQCEYEFSEKLIQQASYQGLKIRKSNDKQVMFLANETIQATDGTVDTHSIEVVLNKEQDGNWRVVQERLLSKEEASHLGIV
jgi:ketosteroid isomerase-like protein